MVSDNNTNDVCSNKDCVGIITDRQIIHHYITAEDFPNTKVFDDNFSKWKYKLRLGNEAYLSTEDAPRKLQIGDFLTIKPGDFALLITEETISLPNDIMAFISMRFDYKQKGLINVSGFHVDPLYNGKLIFSAFNAGSREIVIRRGDPVFMIFFEKLRNPIAGERKEEFKFIPAEMIEQIRGRSATLASNASRLDKIEFYVKVIGGILISTVLTLAGVILKHYLEP